MISLPWCINENCLQMFEIIQPEDFVKALGSSEKPLVYEFLEFDFIVF
jgi:hypothetical protein